MFEALVLLSGALAWISLLMVSFNFLTADRLEKFAREVSDSNGDLPRVALLIPFRNEATNLKRTLPFLRKIQYPNLKVILLDDQSTDIGPFLAQDIALHDPNRFLVVQSQPLPPGWIGKNWACHQLSLIESELRRASGGGLRDSDLLIFCDADVEVSPAAVAETVHALDRKGADALTAFPAQEFGTWSEKAVIPLVMQLPIFSLLPLKLLPYFRSPQAVVANGQWLAMKRSAYQVIAGHQGVRGKVLEDMEIGRRLHIKKQKLLPVVASMSLKVRMYQNFRELSEGFGKNLSALTGNHILGGFFAVVWILLGWGLALLSPLGLLAIAFQRILLIRLFRLPPTEALQSFGLHLVGVLVTSSLIFYSYFLRLTKRATWKGRSVSV